MVNEAHLSAMNSRNITSGFKNTGIYPYNRQIFNEDDFAPSITTNNDLLTEEVQTPEKSHLNNNSNTALGSYVCPSVVYPLPKAEPRIINSKGRKKGSSKILTNTPVRNDIAQASETKSKQKPKATKPPPSKKSLFNPIESELESDDEVLLDDTSEDDLDEECNNCIEGDFVVVKVTGKASVKNFRLY